MTQSERLKRVVGEQQVFINRAKVRDSSEQTTIVKARASGTYLPQTSRIQTAVTKNVSLQTDSQAFPTALSTVVTIDGKGTNKDHDAILESKQNAAICSDISPALWQYGTLPPYIYSRVAPPFSQQTLSTAYTAPCSIPGKNVYFPPFLQRGLPGDNCNYTHLPNDSG